MAYTRRKFSSDVKSLLHFDYPYFAEPSDGCRDEVSGETWTRVSGGIFAGSEIPADKIVSGLPKFGYRCLSGTNAGTGGSYLTSTNVSGIWNLDPSKQYEWEFFLYPTSFTDSSFVQIKKEGDDSAFKIGMNTNGELTITHLGASPTLTRSGKKLTLNTWNHILVRVNNKALTGYIDGLQAISGTLTKTDVIQAIHARLFYVTPAYMDEFIFRHSAKSTAPTVPTEPYQGTLDIKNLGSFGDGKHGAVTITKDTQINAYARVTAITGTSITHSGWKQGTIEPQVGCEVMLLVTAKSGNAEEYLGSYAFRKITALNTTTTFTIDEAITAEFPGADCAKNYIVQAILVPNFTTLTLTAGKIIPLTYAATTGGGIIAFRAKNNVTMSGSAMIISSGYGPERTDLQQVCHANLLDKFICNKGGGIYIICGGVFTAGSANRIGATWDGSLKGGTFVANKAGTAGGAGYGGGGGSDSDSGAKGGLGGVGGGGGGHDSSPGYTFSGINAGASGDTGGAGANSGTAIASYYGGTQGKRTGGKGATMGGGGAGGNSGKNLSSGANLILISKSLKVDAAVISTGGNGGATGNGGSGQDGGSGTGFCYIACEEMN